MRPDCKNIVLKEMAVLYSNDLPKYSRNLHDPLMAILMLGIADRPFLVFSRPKIQKNFPTFAGATRRKRSISRRKRGMMMSGFHARVDDRAIHLSESRNSLARQHQGRLGQC